MPFTVSSRWFEGSSDIVTYALDELPATKLRALYQRRKGRDLFDLAVALEETALDPERVIAAFLQYMEHGGHDVTRAQFERNVQAKLRNAQFNADIGPLLAAGFSWEREKASDPG